MLEEDSRLKRDEISRLGNILNSRTEILDGFSIEHRIVREGNYRFAPPKEIIDVRELYYHAHYSNPLIRRIKAAYLLGRLYRNSQNTSERQRAEAELNKSRIGRFFMYF